MRKTTEKVLDAFMNGKNATVSNTMVGNIDLVNTGLYLFGNLIARRNKETGIISITNSGWATVTTKERLNALPGVSISSKKGVWYLNGKEWNGGWIDILPLP